RVEKGSVHVAIAGQSMGGFGAMSYTARHPGLFGTAGEFSGAVDTDLDWPVAPVAQEQVANLPDGKAADDCIWGDPVTQHQLWLSHDPTNLAARLRGVALYLASGTGAPDPNNPSSFTNPGGALTEAGIYQMNQGFLSALRQDGITPAAVNFYPFGVHDWPYWRADLAQFLRLLSTDGFRR
ncbi:MAG TPA: alpha/beta hydrolase-fold protein, partial [Acidimicrobiales bacterium]|nr:alpha/beta hydrolase-fold protein [Acidimicrobiales bacterium]